MYTKNIKVLLQPGICLLALLLALLVTGCGGGAMGQDQAASGGTDQVARETAGADIVTAGESLTGYARGLDIFPLKEGAYLIRIEGEGDYLALPRGVEAESLGDFGQGVTVVPIPAQSIYLASSSCMDFFLALDSLSCVAMTSTEAGSWTLPEAVRALESEEMYYIGRYSAPDYEAMMELDCDLAIENTMVYHQPEVRQQIEGLGIPVIVERSSQETDPLGRLEWIKLYGVLSGRAREAVDFFDRQLADLETALKDVERAGCRVAIFYYSSNGNVVVRTPGDYLTRMVELAGGEYFLKEASGAGHGTSMSMEAESFYLQARDADIIIYNGTIDGGVASMAELLEKNPLLADFRAVESGAVYCSSESFFQKTTAIADMTRELAMLIAGGDDGQLRYFHKLH